MATRRSFRCPSCGILQELRMSLHAEQTPLCVTCRVPMRSSFGDFQGRDVVINYGYRESRYATEEERNLAKFQFTNL